MEAPSPTCPSSTPRGAPSRREALATSVAALACALLSARALARAAKPDPGRQAVDAAAASYRRDRTFESFVDWTEALKEWGDYDQVRQNLGQVEPRRSEWGKHRARIERLWHAVSFREFRVEWDIPFSRLGSPTPSVLYLAIPRTAGDAVRCTAVDIDGVRSWRYQTDYLGNRCIEAVPAAGVNVRLAYTATLWAASYRKRLARFDPGPLPKEVQPYLIRTGGPGQGAVVAPDGPLAQAVIRELALEGLPAPERLERLLRWAKPNLRWIPPEAEGVGSASEAVLKARGGHCEQAASALAALARAAGIPARLVRGSSAVEPGTANPLFHSVPEYYLHGIGWVVPDAGQPLWSTLCNCVWMYHSAAPGDPSYRLQYLEGIEFNPPPRMLISKQTLLREALADWLHAPAPPRA